MSDTACASRNPGDAMNAPYAHITFVEDAALLLAEHPGYVWNRSETRIRCTGTDCSLVMDVAGGFESGDAADIFALHQAEMLLDPVDAEDSEDWESAEGRQGTCRHCRKQIEVRNNQWTHTRTSSGSCDTSIRFSPFSDMAAPMTAGV